MGWSDTHLYLFHVDGEEYGEPDTDWDDEVRSSKRAKLEDVIAAGGTSFSYEYDLGDSWTHEITLERTLETEGKVKPRCTGGARACPPEDCGGPWGYKRFLQAIGTPRHREHEAMLEWIGGNFDPEHFDAKLADSVLSRR